jgi:hypothetical protein
MAFRVFQSLWAMGGLPYGDDADWSIAEKIAKVVEGDFDGIEIAWIPPFSPIEAVGRAQAAGVAFGLVCMPTSVDEFRSIVDTVRRLDPGPVYVDLQPNIKVFSVDDGVPYLRECLKISTGAGFRTLVETHRDRMTTDLRFTLQLLDALPEMRMNADLSHFVVGQEFAWPVGEEDQALVRRVVERSDMFHGRVASNQQVQIPIAWEHHRPWLELFLDWWEDGFRLWQERSDPGDDLVFVTEIGPPPYAITGPDGREMSDRWDEALLLTQRVREIWQRVDARSTAARGRDGVA